VKQGGLEEQVDSDEKEANERAVNNMTQVAKEQYEAIGGIYGVLTVLILVAAAGGMFFTSTGKQLGATAFVIAFIIPHYLRAFVMWILSSVFNVL
jgi:hypothetical protein